VIEAGRNFNRRGQHANSGDDDERRAHQGRSVCS
jgi:hypothetical protein